MTKILNLAYNTQNLPYKIPEQKHKTHINNAIGQIVGGTVELQQRVELSLQHGERFEEFLRVHHAQ